LQFTPWGTDLPHLFKEGEREAPFISSHSQSTLHLQGTWALPLLSFPFKLLERELGELSRRAWLLGEKLGYE
jgi:hypothetical protein